MKDTFDSTFQAIDAATWTSILQIIVDGMAGKHSRQFCHRELPIALGVQESLRPLPVTDSSLCTVTYPI
jgi:hypothetical protein